MILPVIALMAGLGCFFTALAYWRQGVVDFLIATVIWFGTAAGSLVVQIPYQVWTGSEVAMGVQNFASAEAMLAWLFVLLGMVMFSHVFYLIFVKGPKL